MSSDGIHPNLTGQYWIATYLANALKTGACPLRSNLYNTIR